VGPKPTLTRTLAAALTTAALAAPAAPAQPADLHASDATNAVTSLPGPPAWPKHPQPITSTATPPGLPTWPEHPQPIKAANAPAETGGGTAWSTIGLGLAGAGLLAGAAGIAGRSRRRTSRSRAAS
jgi:hypothetical protein